MCDFCSREIWESCKRVEKLGVDMGDLGGVLDLSVWMIFEDEEDDRLDFTLSSSTGDTIKEINLPIKYCPMCGRKLKGE